MGFNSAFKVFKGKIPEDPLNGRMGGIHRRLGYLGGKKKFYLLGVGGDLSVI